MECWKVVETYVHKSDTIVFLAPNPNWIVFRRRLSAFSIEKYHTEKCIAILTYFADIDIPSLLYTYGEYFYTYAYRRGYDKMMMTLGHDFQSFVDNLNFLHSLLALTYKGMKPPHFGYSNYCHIIVHYTYS